MRKTVSYDEQRDIEKMAAQIYVSMFKRCVNEKENKDLSDSIKNLESIVKMVCGPQGLEAVLKRVREWDKGEVRN